MGYTKCMIFLSFCSLLLIAQKASSQDCVLTRNEFNDFPFVLKILADDELWAHGSLITPIRVLSWQLNDVGSKTIVFVAEVYDSYGPSRCSVIRKPKTNVLPPNCGNPENPVTVCWEMETPFPSDPLTDYPFLFTTVNSMMRDAIYKNLNDTKDKERCEVPLYDSMNHSDSSKLSKIVNFVKRENPLHKSWSERTCKGDIKCKHTFFAYQTVNRLSASRYYEGGIILCRGEPIGMLLKVMEQPNDEWQVLQFEPLTFAESFIAFAEEEWPSPASATESTMQSTTELNITFPSIKLIQNTSRATENTTRGTNPPTKRKKSSDASIGEIHGMLIITCNEIVILKYMLH